MSGFYVMHREWMKHPALDGNGEPFCRRAAWAYLIERARWADGDVNFCGQTVPLKRGQAACSLRYLANAWNWDQSKVRRFLARLVADSMIEINNDFVPMCITVCNYTIYQLQNNGGDAPSTQDRRDLDANKNKLNKQVSTISGGVVVKTQPDRLQASAYVAPSSDAKDEDSRQGSLLPTASVVSMPTVVTRFEEFWKAYPRKVAKPTALKAYRNATAVATHDAIMAGLQNFKFGIDPQFRPHPSTWLNQQRWEDEDPEMASTRKPASANKLAPDDPWGIQTWCATVPGVRPTTSDTERSDGKWKNADGIIDAWAGMIVEACRFPPDWRGDLNPILEWMKTGLFADDVVEIINGVVAWNDKNGRGKIFSLNFFNNEIRRRQGVA